MKRHISGSFILILALALLLVPSCKDDNAYGKLGIQVPIGQGKVRDKVEKVNGIVYGPYVITGVFEGSPAYIAGIRPDDVILQIDGVDISDKTYDNVYHNLLMGKPGSSVTLLIKRGKQQMVFKVVRGE